MTSHACVLEACVHEMHFGRCKKSRTQAWCLHFALFVTYIKNVYNTKTAVRYSKIMLRPLRVLLNASIQYRVYSPNIALDDFSSSSEAASTTAMFNMSQKTLRGDEIVMSLMRRCWARCGAWHQFFLRAHVNITNDKNKVFLGTPGVAWTPGLWYLSVRLLLSS